MTRKNLLSLFLLALVLVWSSAPSLYAQFKDDNEDDATAESTDGDSNGDADADADSDDEDADADDEDAGKGKRSKKHGKKGKASKSNSKKSGSKSGSKSDSKTDSKSGSKKSDAAKSGGELKVPLGESMKLYWECGFNIQATGGDCGGINITQPIPTEWPEQKVRIVKEDVSPYVKIGREKNLGGTTILPMTISSLPKGEKGDAILRFEIESFAQEKPKNVEKLVRPEGKQISKEMRESLKAGHSIESNDKAITKLAREIGTDEDCVWNEVKAVYDWVRKEVKYQNGPIKGAVKALHDKTADSGDLVNLFIAICRAKKIPARTVFVPEHAYAEFYLVDDTGAGRWFPCQVAGDEAFGEMPTQYIILQKGENFKSLATKGKVYRLLPQEIKGKASRSGGGQPSYTEIHRKVENVDDE